MIDLIFQNQMILISILASLLPMVMSMLIVFMAVISHSIQVRYEKKQAAIRKTKILEMKREKLRRQRVMELREQEEAAAGIPLGGVVPPDAAEQENAEEQSEDSQEDKPDSAIQDILSSVFAEDEAAPIFELLLRDTEPIEIIELENLAEEVSAALAAQLGGLAS